ncbi:glutaredoxin 3 [Povalibacter sp.]|uniref:glutaredoxin 3 n=1 Tax=Povalibacter sp. TaxID=1962978 RepID=UPI002F4156E8
MSTASVVMYSTAYCGYCVRARNLLERKGVAVQEIKVDEDMTERETMLRRSGGRRTVPQIFIGERHVGGYDDLAALDAAGELDQLLGRTT